MAKKAQTDLHGLHLTKSNVISMLFIHLQHEWLLTPYSSSTHDITCVHTHTQTQDLSCKAHLCIYMHTGHFSVHTYLNEYTDTFIHANFGISISSFLSALSVTSIQVPITVLPVYCIWSNCISFPATNTNVTNKPWILYINLEETQVLNMLFIVTYRC